MIATRERWISLCHRFRAKENHKEGITLENAYNRLISAYSGRDRFYHNLNHISDGLIELDSVKNLAGRPDILEMAWWWHDKIYDTRSHSNEYESAIEADHALYNLKISTEIRNRIHQLIMATKHDFVPPSFDQRLIIDIDLVSLATPPEIFDQNTANIREEYREAVPDNKVFTIGRIEFFKKFLASRPSIYLTNHFRNKYEALAQENLKRIIALY